MSCFLYHGFPPHFLASILRSGLARNQQSVHGSTGLNGLKGLLYLTDCLAPKYAFDTNRQSMYSQPEEAEKHTVWCVAMIDVAFLDESLFLPDEYWLSVKISKEIRDCKIGDLQAHRESWKDSLDASGKVAYAGDIPLAAMRIFTSEYLSLPDELREAIGRIESDAINLCTVQRFNGIQATRALCGEPYIALDKLVHCSRECDTNHDLQSLGPTNQVALKVVKQVHPQV